MKKLIVLVVLTFLLAVGSFSTKATWDVGASSGSTDGLNESWRLGANPYIDKDFLLKPVVVTSVTTHSSQGTCVITKVAIKARGKAVRSVRLRWYLSTEEKLGRVIATGETAEIQVPGGILPGSTKELECRVLSFDEIRSKVLEVKSNSRDLRIDVDIAKVKFEDAQTWREQAKSRLDYMTRQDRDKAVLAKASFNPATGKTLVPVVQIGTITTV